MRQEVFNAKEEFDRLVLWRRAVESLAKKHPKGRFLRVIVPAVGWAKYLNLPEREVESFLRELLSDKEDLEKDLRTAFRKARELTFNVNGDYDGPKPSDYLQKAVDYIQSKGGEVRRQELLKEVFQNQGWLTDLVMEYLERKGFVVSRMEKDGGRGRPFKLYKWNL